MTSKASDQLFIMTIYRSESNATAVSMRGIGLNERHCGVSIARV